MRYRELPKAGAVGTLDAAEPAKTLTRKMELSMSEYLNTLVAMVKAKNPAEPEFHQAVLHLN